MRYTRTLLLLAFMVSRLLSQDKDKDKTDELPSNEKAQKTYKQALDYLHRRMPDEALEEFKKADKQEGGHCVACQKMMIKHGVDLREWKTAEIAAEEMVAQAQGDKNIALANYQF